MKIYLGFDDTDTHNSLYGTGKLVRWFKRDLPTECKCIGVVRQQLFVCDKIPYTSHNSSACLIAEIPEKDFLYETIQKAVIHLNQYAVDGSDPGLCVVAEFDSSLNRLADFGYLCTHAVTTQKQAMDAAGSAHLSGHGGTNDGIIGAAAAVGLTFSGWSGRFIEFGDLRNMPDKISVADLNRMGIKVVSMDRDARVPAATDTVITNGWLRPRLSGYLPVLFVNPIKTSVWQNIYWKRNKSKDHLKKQTPIKATV
jgi:hypothetical protein